ncbi:helix-turn-helix domain-containing protein [Planococcus shenhongbingii]|uniref:helix-turn-helix domain-containing protein n=1 Tax=Planococcus shenhongbingii TaxID=3058398 RepID=UPI002618B390|nr:helix-turn-helix domain-containing protein [Planococcus sp. N016]WKA57253.1 helix-turn-helix domain-containing protein [Planococcus sp. N016]
MLFEELVITIMKAVNLERTISSPFHLIKGKKSGQTIQDIGYYGLYPYFAVMPKLEKQLYDEVIQRLFRQQLLKANDEVIDLTEKALAMDIPASRFNGWKYRGNEAVFLNRLSLVVQTLSYTSQQINRFDPVHNAEDLQSWVKRYLKKINFRELSAVRAFKTEMVNSLQIASISEQQKMIVMQRLTGLGWSGLTWEQIASAHGLHILDAQLAAVEALHAWIDVIEMENFPLLSGLTENIVQRSVLTESTQRTLKLFEKGLSLEEIAAVRQLKTSTIEDHFVELAMNDPFFNYTAFLSKSLYEKIVAVSKNRKTKRLRDIKEELPDASYFQIRLALALKEEQP